MPCEYEKECEFTAKLGQVVTEAYCSIGKYELCSVYVLKKQLEELKTGEMLLRNSQNSYKEQVARGLEKIIEIVREIQR